MAEAEICAALTSMGLKVLQVEQAWTRSPRLLVEDEGGTKREARLHVPGNSQAWTLMTDAYLARRP